MLGYALDELLVGKFYKSPTRSWRQGIIQEAIRRDYCLEADYVFNIRVRNQDTLDDFWATIWVAVED